MSPIATLLAILGALLVGAISPGPSFVLVSRIAVTQSRRDGLAAALGMGGGGLVFATLTLCGLAALLREVASLYVALKVAGGFYLLWLGLRIWRGARQPLAMSGDGTPASPRRSFSVALVTQVSNPKTAVVYGSIFAALLPAAPPVWLLLALPPLVFAVETTWYALVALAFSAERPRSAYLRLKAGIDRLAGLVMAALGTRLILGAIRS